MAFNITTTGSVAVVVFNDLGARTLTHPITIDLQQEYTIEELFESDSIQNALVSGSISVLHNGVSVSDLNDYRVRVSENVINNISNTTGTNTGDETTASIQSKRPIKTIGGQSLEGPGNISVPSSGVQSVTGDGVDNTDPNNPIVNAIPKEHRHIYFAATNTTNTIINNRNIPVKVAGTTTQGFGTNGLVMSGVNRILNQSNRTLRVKVEAVLSLNKEQGSGNDNYTFFINQTGANLIGSKSSSEGRNNDWNTANPTWIGDMANNQWFEVWVQNIDTSNTLEVSDFSLIVTEL